MAHWIGVVHRMQAMTAREAGVVAFGHGKEALVRSLSPGDTVIYYAPKSDFEGEPVQAFVTHARVTGEKAYEKEWRPGLTRWVRDAAFDDADEVPVRPMLEDLTFVRNKRSWGMTFRGGKFSISDEDYVRIATAMGVTP
ncbi:EVE domain-containing protein [Pelagovum pacificum]|uniref:EVE domain-containing protein n=1 Tax=Pelagovum pacificum TaxID=2588711 RepID=A0A5C5GFD3_9RHOB|nr:EVE domain-containing protein [Pelagovum pacificum]QQA43428.1 EVE domain-containing protein [Pelagovum pacificum]TNY33435.1 EVE domain-containing protein [Pelagovum pacificum]